MNQTKKESMIESFINQISGVITAFMVWRFIVIPFYEIPDPGFMTNISITLMFTTISILRSYIWRRFFNAGLHKIVHNYIINGVKK